MPLPTGNVIGLMVDNLRKRRTVFPISRKNATRWARELDIPKGGDTVLYTGSMYQLLPWTVPSRLTPMPAKTPATSAHRKSPIPKDRDTSFGRR